MIHPVHSSEPNHLRADYPATTKWLTDEEKRIAVGRLMRDDAGFEHSSEWQSFKAATKNIKTWAFVFGYMA